MKKSKILIAVFMLMTAASAATAEDNIMNFDGSKGGSLFSQLAVRTRATEFPVAEVAVIPARVFDAAEEAALDRSIGSAIVYVQRHNKSVELAESFECLRRGGTPQEKFDFVYYSGRGAYSFPEACISRNKGICDWVVESVCTTITTVSCAWVTSGDNPPITKKECHDEAKEDCKEVKSWICS